MADVPDPLLATALKAARKTARNYVLIAKGTAAVKLIVQKKKVLAGDIQKAKTESKGTVIVEGTCLGSGSEMVFEVVGDEPSIKTMSIKDLISEQTELKLKPRFQVVKELTAVKEEDEEEGTNEGENEEQQQPNANEVQQQPNADEVQNQAPPPAPPPPPPTAPPTPTEPVSGNDDLLKTLVATMGKLAPQLTTAITTVPTSRGELMGVAAEFQKQIKAKDAAGARESLLKLGQLINGVLATAPKSNEQGSNERESSESEPDAARAAFEKRREALESKLLEAQKLNREKATPLGNVWQYALTQAEGGNLQNAMTAFDRLETAIRDVLAAGKQSSGSEGVVAAGVTRLELEQVRLATAQGIGELEDVLRATNDQRAWAVANIIRDLASKLPTELEEVLGRLEQAVKSQNTQAIASLKEEVRGKAASWTQFLQNNADHIAGCEANPWNIPVRIAAPIQKSLAAVMKVAA